MFYHTYILAKKGQLANVWLAAHWDKKLTKAQIKETDIKQSVDYIIKSQIKEMQPESKSGVPFALRLSAKLLLGIVRIYARQVKFLLEECSEALVKTKMTFRPGVVELPKEQTVATHRAITLSEDWKNAGQLDLSLPEIADDFLLENVPEIRVEEGLNEEDFRNIGKKKIWRQNNFDRFIFLQFLLQQGLKQFQWHKK